MKFDKRVYQAGIAHLFLILLIALIGIKHMGKVYASDFVQGVHFVELDQDSTQSKQVMLFYTPFCKPCAAVHDPIRIMTEKAGAQFLDVPVNFGPIGKDIQEAVVAANEQGIGQPFMHELLTLIHWRADMAPATREELADVIERCGGSAIDYRVGCESLREVADEFDALTEVYYVAATPTLIVNGNKQINLGALASLNELERLINELLEV